MVSKDTSEQIFGKLLRVPENQVCFDCGSDPVEWASINHGSFLCSCCADAHRDMGIHISFVRSIIADPWTIPQLKVMTSGGNSALKMYFSQYDFPDNSIGFKYRTRAAQHYREMLKSLSGGRELSQQQPSNEEGKELLDNEYEVGPQAEKFSFKGALSSVVQKSKELGKGVKNKLHSFNEKPRVKELGAKASGLLNKLGNGIKELRENPGMQRLKNQTVIAYGYVADKTKGVIGNINRSPQVQRVNEPVSNQISKVTNPNSQGVNEEVKE